jgi:hypothetical protein
VKCIYHRISPIVLIFSKILLRQCGSDRKTWNTKYGLHFSCMFDHIRKSQRQLLNTHEAKSTMKTNLHIVQRNGRRQCWMRYDRYNIGAFIWTLCCKWYMIMPFCMMANAHWAYFDHQWKAQCTPYRTVMWGFVHARFILLLCASVVMVPRAFLGHEARGVGLFLSLINSFYEIWRI